MPAAGSGSCRKSGARGAEEQSCCCLGADATRPGLVRMDGCRRRIDVSHAALIVTPPTCSRRRSSNDCRATCLSNTLQLLPHIPSSIGQRQPQTSSTPTAGGPNSPHRALRHRAFDRRQMHRRPEEVGTDHANQWGRHTVPGRVVRRSTSGPTLMVPGSPARCSVTGSQAARRDGARSRRW